MKKNQTSLVAYFQCFLAMVVFFWGVPGDCQTPPQSMLECTVEGIQAVVYPNVTIESAKPLSTDDGCTYCRVDGYVKTMGPDEEQEEPNHVKFMLSLPDSFTKRYFFVGLGGAAGYVPDPPDVRLQEGFAVAGTDTGHQGFIIDYRFGINRTQAFDYAQRGVHVTAVVTQAITRAYYGLGTEPSERLFRYIEGCSGGGRMGNVSAIEHPEDFDGIVASAPGINPGNVLFFGKLATFLLKNPGAWISYDKLLQFEQAVLAMWDGADGAIDGFIWDHTKVDFDPASLGIFTDLQLETIQLMLNGLVVDGKTYYPGFPLSNPSGWSEYLIGSNPPPWDQLPGVMVMVFDTASRSLFGLDYDFTTQFDFDDPDDVKKWGDTFEKVYMGSGTAIPAYLDNLKQAGGKIIFWHGVSDNAISVNDTIRYYEELVQAQGGYSNTQTFARLFLAPGVFHCFGGPGPQDTAEQALQAMIRWVEYGEPPEDLITHSDERTFLLCPYPNVSFFLGGVANRTSKDVDDVSNWKCRPPGAIFPCPWPWGCS